ncbi:MAG: GNAT family N-acetyltransferase [Defluviitaleaceae bacterium]|nr:GNAT family N-acetyltransferase [Defluviitaleaceae bacterium]
MQPFNNTGLSFETPRLILRPFTQDDLHDFNAYASVPGVGEAAGWPHHKTLDESQKILDLFLCEKANFALYHKADAKVVGSLGLHKSWTDELEDYNHLSAYEMGYVLSKDYWGQGLVPEAAHAVIRYLFDERKLDAISICHFKENAQSRRVIEKLGFAFVMEDVYYSKQMDVEFDDMKYLMLAAK